MDYYLGVPARDWAAEALDRVPGQITQRDSAVAALERGLTTAPPRRSLEQYAGIYADSLFGPIIVRAEAERLTLQMGRGRPAVLEPRGDDEFLVRWKDPFFRE